ncbi:MAG TPA: histidine kinase [Chitinophagaceae bacterium]
MGRLALILFFCSLFRNGSSQPGINFQHLNTSNGLSYIGATNMCADQRGNIWIATGYGLNMFNGKTTEKYFASEHPELGSSNILQVLCDNNNRIWVLTVTGNVTVLDESRQFHRVTIYDSSRFVKTIRMLQTSNATVSLYTAIGNYTFKNGIIKNKDSIDHSAFHFLPIKGFHELGLKGRSQVFNYDEEHYLLVHPAAIVKINLKTNAVEKKYLVPDCKALIKWGQDQLLCYDQRSRELKAINLNTEELGFPFRNSKDQFGKPVSGIFLTAAKISDSKYLFGTEASGIYICDVITGKVYNYKHSFSDPTSIASNYTDAVTAGKEGWVFVTSIPNGISYFKLNEVISSQYIFADNYGNGYDGYIAGIATGDNNKYYLGTVNGMMEWNRNINTTHFIDFIMPGNKSVWGVKQVGSIGVDHTGKIWATVHDSGVVVMDKNKNLLRYFKNDSTDKQSLKVKKVNRILIGPDDHVWLCGYNGISRIDPVTLKVDNFENTPLAMFDSLHVVPLWFTDKNNLWIAASFDGLFHYNLLTKELSEVEAFKRYKKDGILDLKVDSFGTIYIGNRAGVQILFKDGRVKELNQKNGLLVDRGEGLLIDAHNRVWIGNDIGLVCYNPPDSSLKIFDVRYGLSIFGFRLGSYIKAPNGEFVLGTPRGIQYFHPDSLYNKKINLNISVTKVETKNISAAVSGNETFRLRAGDNHVSFYFGSVDFSPHLRTYYEYKLIDIDKDWIKLADQNSVRYNSLPPGKYIFKVRISNDNKTWQEASNEVTIVVAVPFYQSWWFKILAVVIGSLLIWYVFKYYQRKQQKHREELETELVINYFASQINSRYKTDELLWDVAKNLIGKLGFEDCMIYLWNDDKNVLIQKAGYGSKGSMQEIMDRTSYYIPRGKGIVGAAVESKQNVLVNDTSKDKRYFTADGKIMLSELCVPLIHDNEVLGAINIEHHQRNFFTAKHLKMLSTIAVLCATQIQRIRAEEEKQQARIEALQNKQKAVETRLQTLRLQMNPHFLFNALNSIQQMILANEEIIATRYLSRFSKLLRTILVHSDKEYVSLKEELEILTLYIELESIRFKDSFNYTIECDDEIDTDEIKLPTLLIQPFVENAIWHGLMHKEGERLLTVKFSEKDECIQCVVEDNGIGRDRSNEVKLAAGQGNKHTSKGIAVSIERLKAMGNGNGNHGSMQIVDLKDENGNAKGTRVEIIFPIQNN